MVSLTVVLSALPSPLVAAVLTTSAPAQSRPATWDMSPDELKAMGLGQTRAQPIPRSQAAWQSELPPRTAGQTVIFVNFDGVTLVSGFPDNAPNNVSSATGGTFAPYGSDAQRRAATMEAVRADWAEYNVAIVDERPSSGPYTMNVTSPSNFVGQGVLGIAPLDCGDQEGNNITFAFHSANDSFPASVQATTISQEVAHSFGLEHVNQPADIMNPSNAGGDPSFRDECLSIVQGGDCGAQHQQYCGSSQLQNSHQELLGLFGPSAPDLASPVVAIVSPDDGEEFVPGDDFTIVAEANDDDAVEEVELYIDGMSFGGDTSEPYSWEVSGIPAGTYDLWVVARDASGNETTSATVTIAAIPTQGGPSDDNGGADTNGQAGADGTGGDGGDAGGDDGYDEAAGDSESPSDSSPRSSFGQDEEQTVKVGCACSSAEQGGHGPGRGVWWAFAMTPVFMLCRRRR